ncbi:MAG: S8 family serine peptidase [candidate division Zixibacteria bacterium]|nr:S8 family serine peptidase [candidate division Zixibacteria bacterium]
MADNIADNYYIRRPVEPFPDNITSGAEAVTNADIYHSAGYDGTGAVIGIVDLGFAQLSSAEANGDIPPDPEQRVDIDYTGQGMESGSLVHGTACAEIVYDMAPGAIYRLYRISNSTHFGLAVDDGISNGVNIWSHSIGWYNRGWHDDTGEICEIANSASQSGQIFCTSAGNRAHAHWQGLFRDIDTDNFHEWYSEDEYNRMPEPGYYIANGGTVWLALQWNIDGDEIDNYDIYLYDDPAGNVLLASSENSGENYEFLSYTNNSGNSAEYWFAVEYISGDSAEFEVFSSLTRGFEYFVSSSSISSPCNASGEFILSAGAVDVDNFEEASPEIIFYSSRGPTNDGSLSPKITGPTNCQTFSSGSFGGTSCSAPNIAGAAALRWDYETYPDASIVKEYLLTAALSNRDWGSPGIDYTFGYGGLFLGLPDGWGLITGRVSEPEFGNGIPAVVSLVNRAPRISVDCDDDGYYALPVPADTMWEIVASGGEVYVPDSAFLSVSNRDTTLLDFVLDYSVIANIDITPDNYPPFWVPAGQSFYYTGTLKNKTGDPQSIDVRLSLKLPDGSSYGPVNQYFDIHLDPWEELVIDNIEQRTPSYAPDGEYWYIAQCGNSPSELIDADSFQFIIFHWDRNMDYNEEWQLPNWLYSKEINENRTLFSIENYPNPFNSNTYFVINLQTRSNVKLEIYNLLGRKVDTIIDDYLSSGNHKVKWDAESFSSGTYFYKIIAGDHESTSKLTLLK